MTSKAVAAVCAQQQVVQSFIRPRVSNDNAHIESVFGTLKTRVDYPGVFADIAQARRWMAGFVQDYNNTGHSGLAGYTPNQVAQGTWRQAYKLRVEAKQAYDTAHPERVPAHAAPVGVVPEKVKLAAYHLSGAEGGRCPGRGWVIGSGASTIKFHTWFTSTWHRSHDESSKFPPTSPFRDHTPEDAKSRTCRSTCGIVLLQT